MSQTTINTQDLQTRLTEGLTETASEFVPWFLDQMPKAYFKNIDEQTRLEHMRAILALRASGQEPRLRMRSTDGRRVTYVLPQDYPGMLVELLRDFGDELIRSAKLYSAKDGGLVIDIFEVGPSDPCDTSDPIIRKKLTETLALAKASDEEWDEEWLTAHLKTMNQDYVLNCVSKRILTHARLYREVRRSGGASVVLDNSLYKDYTRVIVAVANMPAKRMLIRIANRFRTMAVNMDRSYVDAFHAGEEESVVIVSAVVQAPEGGQIDPNSSFGKRLRRDLLRLKWLDPETLELGFNNPQLGLSGADILHTFCDLTHQLLVKTNRYVYSRARVREIAEQHVDLSAKLADLFRDRFDVEMALDDADYALRENKIRDLIDSEIEDEVEHTVFSTLLLAIGATLKTNYYVVGRYALALRLAPELLMTIAPRPETPYGIFFVHGRDFNAFHVRFRETARGGVRVVRPNSAEQYVRETERHFDEVYGLAYAQQLKNKDIPEGGAKAVILVRPGQTITRCVRAFTDSILDLIVDDPKTLECILDRYGRPEWIYLGPDENITPEHINWVVDRAHVRGYEFPNALMSSKPGAGINHKEYGVTSEGVNVFLEVALNAIGINPRKNPFSVKITGGPDGDVAGNEMKILIREYGRNVKIVGIADGFGCAEDPAGLDQDEIMRLVRASEPIASFKIKKLSPKGKVTLVSDPDGVRLRNEMHNRVISDAFIPAGGRPETINSANWSRFLSDNGSPSSKVIVEGANLFITPDARKHLFDAGVVVVKDSSANKCGVICSSYEIMASLVISESEFMEIKQEYVKDILNRLREVAGLEAELLFEEHKRRPKMPLVDLSIMLSKEINRLTDAVAADYHQLVEEYPEIIQEVILAHVPPVLREKAGDRLWTKLPETYRAQIACAGLASRIIYREGLDHYRDTPDEQLARLALAYVLRDKRNHALVDTLEASDLPDAQEIADLLRIGGTRAGLQGKWHRHMHL